MALIDRDETLERMKSMAGCATCDNYNWVRCRACSWDDAMNIVEELPIVDAVPVEWLEAQINDAIDDNETELASDIGWLIRKYINEQEEM